jgi:hypothetical protein
VADISVPLIGINNRMSFIKAIPYCQYKMTVHMTDGLNSNTVPLTVQFRTQDTDDSTYNVQTDDVMRDLSALNGDVGDSSPLRRDASFPFQ